MEKSARRASGAAGVLGLVLALGGCGLLGGAPAAQGGPDSSGPTTGAAVATPSPSPSDEGPLVTETLPSPTAEPTLRQAAPPTSGADVGTSTYTVAQYVDYIIASADTYWTAWMKNGYGLQEPFVGIEVVEPNEQAYQTGCTSPGGGASPPTPHDWPNAYYCPSDVKVVGGVSYQGVIVLPATTFQKMWNGDIFNNQSKKVGDFAAAYLIAHEFGHHIADEFTIQAKALGRPMPAVTGANNELLADCFSGAWISYAFSQGVLTDTDYDEAIAAAEAIGDKPGGINNDPHGSPAERMQALRIGAEFGANGYAAGHPAACTTTYWR